MEHFPNEKKEIYYIAPIPKICSKRGKPGVAKGKLIDKYRNSRTKLREAGLIKRKTFSSDIPLNDDISGMK